MESHDCKDPQLLRHCAWDGAARDRIMAAASSVARLAREDGPACSSVTWGEPEHTARWGNGKHLHSGDTDVIMSRGGSGDAVELWKQNRTRGGAGSLFSILLDHHHPLNRSLQQEEHNDTAATLHPHVRSTCTHLSQAMPCQCVQLPMRNVCNCPLACAPLPDSLAPPVARRFLLTLFPLA